MRWLCSKRMDQQPNDGISLKPDGATFHDNWTGVTWGMSCIEVCLCFLLLSSCLICICNSVLCIQLNTLRNRFCIMKQYSLYQSVSTFKSRVMMWPWTWISHTWLPELSMKGHYNYAEIVIKYCIGLRDLTWIKKFPRSFLMWKCLDNLYHKLNHGMRISSNCFYPFEYFAFRWLSQIIASF